MRSRISSWIISATAINATWTMVGRIVSRPIYKTFWTSFNDWFLSHELAQALMNRLAGESWPAVSIESQFIRHRAGYFLGPHSDLYTKLVVLLLYLAPDDSAEHSGTSLIVRRRRVQLSDSKHYAFDDFVRVKTRLRPNSLLAFVRSDISFHGWSRCRNGRRDTAGRDVIQYVIHDKAEREAQLEARRSAAQEANA
jgi:hypothetical protein